MNDDDRTDGPTRRQVLAAGGISLAAIGLAAAGCSSETTTSAGTSAAASAGSSVAADPQVTATGASGTICVLTPEVTQGPYYLDNQQVRENITEGKPGFPLNLTLTVVDVTDGCKPIPDTPVEIWHCDAWGYYSGYTDKAPGGTVPAEDGVGDDQTFLRGVQVTGADGAAKFVSIMPGWYSPRVTHIHVKVHHGGEVGKTYEGGTTVQTTQILFPDDVVTAYAALKPYSQHELEPTKLASDQVYGEAKSSGGNPDAMVPTLKLVKDGSVQDGYNLTMTLGVDPDRSSGTGGGGGQPPSGGPGGTPPSGGPGGTPPSGGPGGTPPTGTPGS